MELLPTALQFVPLSQPCRAVDTRPQYGGSGPIQGGTHQDFPISGAGGCGSLPSAAAYSLNVSVVPQGPLGYLTVWPAGQPQPLVSTLNSLDGRIKANAAIVPAGTGGTDQRVRHQHHQCDPRRQWLLRAGVWFHAGLLSADALSRRRHARQHLIPRAWDRRF